MNNKDTKFEPKRRGPMGGGGHGPMGHGGGSFEKPKDFKGTMKKFLGYVQPYKIVILIAFVCSALGAVFTIIGPTQVSNIVELIESGLKSQLNGGAGIDLDGVVKIGVTMAIIYGLGFFLSYAQGFIMASTTHRIGRGMRKDLSAKINRLPLKYFDKVSFGDVLSRITNDVDTIGQTLNMSVGQLTNAITLFFGSLIMMFVTNIILTFVALASTILSFAIMMVIIKSSQKHFIAQQRELGKINGHIEETYSGLNIVTAFNDQEKSIETFKEINNTLYKSAWKSQFFSGVMMPLMNFVGNLGYVSVCVVGAVLAMNGKIGFEVIVSFMMYIRLFTMPLAQLGQAMTNLQSTAAAAERVFDFMEEEELSSEKEEMTVEGEIKAPINEHESQGHVEFRDVDFGYNESKMVVKGFNAEAKSGQKIAIVGPTGSGKTTIVNLLMRFYEPNAGEILIDGIPISQMTRKCVHDQFCMVLQDTWLFEGTIRENIVYSMKNVSDEDVKKAAKAVGLHHFIKSLPKGYDTVLGDNASLSAGQKQLLTIARAIIENAPLLILDEATSSVDTRTEIQIQNAMDALTKGRTSFIIAHRLSTIKSADQILVMKDGEIIERGNHEDLLKLNGFYANLYMSQFEDKAS